MKHFQIGDICFDKVDGRGWIVGPSTFAFTVRNERYSRVFFPLWKAILVAIVAH